MVWTNTAAPQPRRQITRRADVQPDLLAPTVTASLRWCIPISQGRGHCAFTSLVWWQGSYWCAFRRAAHHMLLPPGEIEIWCCKYWHQVQYAKKWTHVATLAVPHGDARDPKLVVVSDTLLACVCGAYLPAPSADRLHESPARNVLQSHLAVSTDGIAWSAPRPLGRPGYWCWSVVEDAAQKEWFAAAYHAGVVGERTSSLHLWATSWALDTLAPSVVMIDGAIRGPGAFPAYQPSEPVLYWADANTLACCARTERTMQLGLAQRRTGYQDWRWWDTGHTLHPGAVLVQDGVTLLAGRELVQDRSMKTTALHTTLYQLVGQHVIPLLRLPSTADCAYPGLAPGPEPDTVLCSFYSQHGYGAPHTQDRSLADVYVACVALQPCRS